MNNAPRSGFLGVRPIDASDVIFQVSEQTAIKQFERTRQHMNTLTGIGFRFALSDFGADNQSFTYLKGLPVDYLRIDCGGYVNDKADPIGRLTADYLIGVAGVLGKSVIADAVKSSRAIEVLREKGVAFAQGSAIGKPRVTIPASSYEKLVSFDKLVVTPFVFNDHLIMIIRSYILCVKCTPI